MVILITGGTGYIGIHTALAYIDAGHDVILVDNLLNSSINALYRLREYTGKNISFYQIDMNYIKDFEKVFKENKIDIVIHCAGFKAVGESWEKPLYYYDNNLVIFINTLKLMRKYNVRNIIFSSSATVYSEDNIMPLVEESRLQTVSPYGNIKLISENILEDIFKSDKSINSIILRYFNPIGAHHSKKFGEDPKGIPNNLVPYITQVLIGKREYLNIFGNDYNTEDGTCIRDYIHVEDLASAHLYVLKLFQDNHSIYKVYNVGTGTGRSVMEVVNSFIKVTGKNLPYKIVNRRDGDIPACYADSSLIQKETDWKPVYSLDDMCLTAWQWQKENPNGYE